VIAAVRPEQARAKGLAGPVDANQHTSSGIREAIQL